MGLIFILFSLPLTVFACEDEVDHKKESVDEQTTTVPINNSVMFGESQSYEPGSMVISQKEIAIAAWSYSAFVSPSNIIEEKTFNWPMGNEVSWVRKKGRKVDGGFQSVKGLVKVFPNPCKGQFKLGFSRKIDNSRIGVLVADMAGQIVYHELFLTREFDENVLEIDLERMAEGVYVISLTLNDYMTTEFISVVK